MSNQFKPRRADYEQAVRDLHRNTPLVQHLDIELDALEPGAASVSMSITQAILQQQGSVHAGVICSIADVACALAGESLLSDGQEMVSTNFAVQLMRPAAGTRLRGDGRVVKAGRRLYFTEAEVFAIDHAGKKTLCARASITMNISEKS